jgi:glucosamine--fructose-6-phosphate aminotransferase (isomerizing)
LTLFLLLALQAGQARGTLADDDTARHIDDMRQLPALITRALAVEDAVRDAARKLSETRDVLFLGRGQMFPLALEGALKLKELSYITPKPMPRAN